MIITGLDVSGIGRFREGARLSGLGPGVNVLAAPNEAGKSTLFRAVRACFFLRHGAEIEALKDLATQGASLPARVAVEFEHRGRSYRIEKRFLHASRAHLSEGGRPVAEGRQADERLWDLLGLAPRHRGNVEDEAAFGLLWVGQGASFRLSPPSVGADDLLKGLIAAEIGGLVGGERARAVLERAEAELGALETPKERRPKAGGPWSIALKRRDELRAREADLRRRLLLLDEDFQALATLQAELGRLLDPGVRAGHEAALRAAEAEASRAAQAADLLEKRRAEAGLAQERRQALEERLAHLQRADERIGAARSRIAELERTLARLHVEADAARERLATASARLGRAESASAALARESGDLARLEVAAEVGAGLDDLIARRDEARAARERLHAIDAELSAIRATPDLVAAAERAALDLARRRAAREAAAARLTVVLGAGGRGQVAVNGELLDEGYGGPVLGPVTVAVGGIATVTVAPPGADAAEAHALAEVERRLADALARMGAASSEEARAELGRAEALRGERAVLARQLAALPKGTGGESGVEELETRISRANGLVRAALREARLATLPAPEALARQRAELAEAEEAGRRERGEAASAEAAARAALHRLEREHSATLAALEAERGVLAHALRAAPDESRATDLIRLARALDEARAEDEATRAAVEAQQAATPSREALVGMRARMERLAQALAHHDEARIGLEKRIHALEVGVERDGGGGLGEEHAAAAAELDLAEREVARREDEVAALRLLRDTVQASLAESRDRYLAPVHRHLAPYLDAVFPDGELDVAQDYTPRGLTRAGTLERHDLLSDGTREQIAVLVRLALGSLLAERGEPVPVILDDALVFSDDGRLKLMLDALQRAGQRHQVIILTCRTRAFAALGGRVLRVEGMPD